jgi:hypothetical protein
MAQRGAIEAALDGARCWGMELDPRYRVLAVTIEPAPLRAIGTPGPRQLLCFPVSVLLVSVTREVEQDGSARTELVTFDIEQLAAVSQRLAGSAVVEAAFGLPEPRPGAWGPRHSLEGRTSASDGTGSTLTLELLDDDGARLRLFARFDDVELRDEARTLLAESRGERTAPGAQPRGPGGASGPGTDDQDPLQF